jgi:hexosaminidase
LNAAFSRYHKLIFPDVNFSKLPSPCGPWRLDIFENRRRTPTCDAISPETPIPQITSLSVSLSVAGAPLDIGVSEAYTLDLPAGASEGTIHADTVWGALRGLETFSQLVVPQTLLRRSSFYVSLAPIQVIDRPRFQWRGLLLDTARHFLPLADVLRTLDAMSYNKLNVLHWHLVDAESFPFESVGFPDLTHFGSFSPESRYSQREVISVVDYARLRGILVVPEMDSPGHTASWGQGYPDAIADCYGWLQETYGDLMWPQMDKVALDVTNPLAFELASSVLHELASLTPAQFVHLGGDEVDFQCWAAVPAILSWMRAHGFATQLGSASTWQYDFPGLQANWTSRMEAVAAAEGKRAVVWEDALTSLPPGQTLRNDTVVNVWRGYTSLASALAAGYNAVMSFGWYVDKQAPLCDGQCDVHWMWIWTWHDMYLAEPFTGFLGSRHLPLLLFFKIITYIKSYYCYCYYFCYLFLYNVLFINIITIIVSIIRPPTERERLLGFNY